MFKMYHVKNSLPQYKKGDPFLACVKKTHREFSSVFSRVGGKVKFQFLVFYGINGPQRSCTRYTKLFLQLWAQNGFFHPGEEGELSTILIELGRKVILPYNPVVKELSAYTSFCCCEFWKRRQRKTVGRKRNQERNRRQWLILRQLEDEKSLVKIGVKLKRNMERKQRPFIMVMRRRRRRRSFKL